MSSYANVIKGGLKLKGGEVLKTKGNKKKKKEEAEKAAAEKIAEETELAHRFESHELHKAPKTAAEKSFEIAQRKRQEDKTLKHVKFTHRERMERFNLQLGSLSEHFDIPKVGPG